MLTCAAVVRGEAADYTLETLQDNPGIYFERMKDVHFTAGTWKILVTINIENLHFDHRYFLGVIEKIKSTCRYDKTPGQCDSVFKTFEHIHSRINNLQREYLGLRNGLSELDIAKEKSFSKRGAPLSLVGAIAKALFGTLDEADGLRIQNEVNQMLHTEKRITQLTREAVHLINKKLTKNDEEMQAMRELFTNGLKKLNDTWETIDRLTEGYEVLWYSSRVELLINNMLLDLGELREEFDILRQMINSAKLGQLHPELIGIDLMDQVILDIQQRYPSLKFPISAAEARGGDLAKISKTTIGFEKNLVVIRIVVPLIERIATELWRIHELPIKQEDPGVAASITTEKQNIAVSSDQSRYTFLENEEVEDCQEVGRQIICRHEDAWFSEKSSQDCEFLLLTRPTVENLRQQCPLTIRENFESYWVYLKASNSWLFSTTDQARVTISCLEGQRDTLYIKGVGMLTLRSSCMAAEGIWHLRTSPDLGGSRAPPYRPGLNLVLTKFSDKLIDHGLKIRQQSNQVSKDIIIKNSRLDEIETAYDRLMTSLEEKENVHMMTTSNLLVTILCIIILIILGVTIGIFYYKNYNKLVNTFSNYLGINSENTEIKELTDPLREK